MTAEKILKQMKDEMPYSLPQYCEPYVLEAIKLGMSQSLPPVSEEEIKDIIKLLEFAKCPNCDGKGIIAYDEDDIEACQWCFERKAVIHVLSRLPQREDQPVGNPDKLEDKQRKDELSDLIKTVVDKKSDGCHNCSVNDCKIFSSGKKCGNWHGYPKDKPRRCFPGI